MMDKMATNITKLPQIETSRSLEYTRNVVKIPERLSVGEGEYHQLQCSNTHSLVVIYDDLFKILGAIYNNLDLCDEVLMHIKTNRRYYADVGEKLLKSKKLKMINWLSSMLYNDLPAGELCVHACSTYLNIHITIDYHHGFWSTLDLPNTNHDLVTLLLDIHLVYRGYCQFNLLNILNLEQKDGVSYYIKSVRKMYT